MPRATRIFLDYIFLPGSHQRERKVRGAWKRWQNPQGEGNEKRKEPVTADLSSNRTRIKEIYGPGERGKRERFERGKKEERKWQSTAPAPVVAAPPVQGRRKKKAVKRKRKVQERKPTKRKNPQKKKKS